LHTALLRDLRNGNCFIPPTIIKTPLTGWERHATEAVEKRSPVFVTVADGFRL
jgi:hypothetical protein